MFRTGDIFSQLHANFSGITQEQFMHILNFIYADSGIFKTLPKFGTKNAFFGYFFTKNASFGYFWARNFKIPLSYLKSAPSNLSICKISRKNKNA